MAALPLIRETAWLAQPVDPVFRDDVAIGDPLADRVILWTRVTPKATTGAETVAWQIARDPNTAQVVSRGEVETGAVRDFTVKLDATGLEPAAGKTSMPWRPCRTAAPWKDLRRVS